MKTSLIQAVKDNQCVTNFSDLYVDLVLNGFIKQIMPYGVFVGFPNNITGLAPKLYMGDIFVDDAGVPYKNGQSVKAKVLEINTEKKRFIVSLRPSHCYKHTDGGVTLLEEYLQERKKACKLLKEIADKKNICQLSIGDVVKATVNDVQGKGVLLSLENGLTAVASTQSTHGVSCEEGMKVEVCVLYLDYANNVAAVTMKPCIVQFAMKKTKQKKVAEIQNGEAVVELVKSDIVVVSLSDGRLALLPGKKVSTLY
ncbi:protein RRP5 homolog, partial [Saccoglossus kowalevskii]